MLTMISYVGACPNSHRLLSVPGWKYGGLCSTWKPLQADPCKVFGAEIRASASRKSDKKSRKVQKTSNMKYLRSKTPLEFNEHTSDVFSTEDDGSSNNSETVTSGASRAISSPRSTVLQACVVTSGFLLTLGVMIREASHIASTQGWGFLDASTEVSFGFEMWHNELIIGLVILISSLRYILLKTWPDFAESSEAANKQVLGSLQPLDYLVVAILPGISEELLFRGALLPLFGLNWKSALVVGAVFGSLHLGSGRKYSFAVWAAFVGIAYGLATIISSNVIVPAVSHSLNNLIGGMLWRYTSNSQEKYK